MKYCPICNKYLINIDDIWNEQSPDQDRSRYWCNTFVNFYNSNSRFDDKYHYDSDYDSNDTIYNEKFRLTTVNLPPYKIIYRNNHCIVYLVDSNGTNQIYLGDPIEINSNLTNRLKNLSILL